MNKRQKLEVMLMRAKIKAKETMKRHDVAWNAQEMQEIKEGADAERKSNRAGQATSA